MSTRRPPLRMSIRLAALAAVLAATAVTLRDADDDEPPRRVAHSQPSAAVSPSTATDTEDAGAPVDLFAVQTWEPPPPPPSPPPPPPPQAPPLPFRFLGRIAADQDTAYLLATADRGIPVRVGDVIDERYLVDKVEAGQLHLIYRPLNIRQTLHVGNGP